MSTNVNFKIQVSLRRAEDDGAVFKKQDGERFESNVTVKLNVATRYSVFVTTRPAKNVQRLIMKSEKLDVERQKPQRNDDNSCVYHSEWTTMGYEVCKSSIRTYVPIVIEMDDGVRVETKLQVKLYPEKETTHSKWGDEFHMLDLECTQKSGQPLVEITKEKYI